jgi:hypothetical protein
MFEEREILGSYRNYNICEWGKKSEFYNTLNLDSKDTS